jgi:putative ABC transport system permease protein
MAWTDRLLNAFRRSRVTAEIDEELQFHIDERTRDNIAAGMTPAAARRDAERRFGGRRRAHEYTRDANLLVWLETVMQDVRFALRTLQRGPLVTAIIIASLALAIGASTAMFSIVNAAMLQALPYAEPDRLVMIWTAHLLNGAMAQNTSVPNLEDWKAEAHTFEAMAAYRQSDGPLVDPTQATIETQWIEYAWVTDNFFSLLGRSASIGRVLRADDFADGRRAAVVAHSLWQQRFGGSPDVIGKRMNIGGFDVDIAGVMPDDFWFPTKDVQLWLPAALNPLWQRSRDNRATRFGTVVGRLAPDAAIDQARAEMRVIAAQLRQQYRSANENLDVNLVPLQVHVLGNRLRFMLEMLFGAVICVLLIACANVANLLLARGVARRREIAIRAALGAGSWRIARQLLTESVLLACAGGGLGLVAVAWSIRAFIALAPADIPRLDEVRVDITVLLFTLVLSVITGLLFGIAPAVRCLRTGVDNLTHTNTRSGAGGAPKLRGTFVVCQVALALVLLAGAGLLVRSLLAVQSVDSGFGDRGVITAHLRFHNSLPRERRTTLYSEAMERIRQLPGVRAVGAVGTMFWNGESGKFGLRAIDGHADKARDQWDALTWTTVRGDYFEALGVPLLRGRFLSATDSRSAPPVVLINETMARRYWPGEDPVGHRIKGFDARGANDEWVTVVGVVKDVHSRGLERAPMAQIFEAQAQSLDETENLVVSAAAGSGLAGTLRRTIRDLDRTAVLADVSTLDDRLSQQSATRRFQTYLFAAFAALALLLAAAGIFATMHYWVVQRTQEIGIRMALGARPRTVLAMVVRETLVLTGFGVGVGLAAALASMRLLTSQLFGVTPHDFATLMAVSTGLTAIAVASCCMPAMRAARVDPMVALRSE